MVYSFFKKFFSFFSLLIFLSYLGNSQRWSQIGSDIDGRVNDDRTGYAVSFNGDGTIVAIGEPHATEPANTIDGRVRVYKYENGSWVQLGIDIPGPTDNLYNSDLFGHSVSLSDDGTILAVGIRK